MFTVGVDIGGTNTDVVLVDHRQTIMKTVKRPTTKEIDQGFAQAIGMIMEGIDPGQIQGVFVGTTHATNALLQSQDLYRVGLIRAAGHHPLIAPCFGWPENLKRTILVDAKTIGGGYECNGSPITSFCPQEAQAAIASLYAQGAESIAVVGTFSPIYPEHEIKIKSLIASELGEDFPVSLSHEIGGIGILERENSTLLNAALRKPLEKGFKRLKQKILDLKIQAPLVLTQNNGTILSLEKALEYPILTVSAGPTNSFIGGAKLAGLQDAIVVDIGGTSTDVGMVRNGFPKRSLNRSHIGGVFLNFPMPDVLSIAMGGGSYISLTPHAIGPKSAGQNLFQEALCFGGKFLTLTDIAIAMQPDLIPGALPVECPDAGLVLQKAIEQIECLTKKMAGKDVHLPIVVVGGGAELLRPFLSPSRYRIPQNASVANAFGAALAEIACTLDLVISLTDREASLQAITEQCIKKAIAEGADPKTTRLVDLRTIPYHYVPGCLTRVIATASGKQKT